MYYYPYTLPPLKVQRTQPQAKLPRRNSKRAAGYDLYSCEEIVIPARGRALIDIGLRMMLPSLKHPLACYGRIAPRSGLTLKHGLDVGAGVIDEDFFGDVKVILFNHTDTPYTVKCGDAIAQLILEVRTSPMVEEIEEVDQVDETIERGTKGFGSTS